MTSEELRKHGHEVIDMAAWSSRSRNDPFSYPIKISLKKTLGIKILCLTTHNRSRLGAKLINLQKLTVIEAYCLMQNNTTKELKLMELLEGASNGKF